MTDITESELIAAIVQAQAQDDTDLPRCEDSEICPAILIWKHGVSDNTARRLLKKAAIAGQLIPATVTYIDPWGGVNRVKGYRAVEEAASSG